MVSIRRSRLMLTVFLAALLIPLVTPKVHASSVGDIFSFLFGKRKNNSQSSGSSNSSPQNNTESRPTYNDPIDEYNEDVNDVDNGGPVVPEPTSLALLGTGLAGLAMAYRRRKKGDRS